MGVMVDEIGGEWNRDAAYHPWIVRIAAEHAGDVLDVGCGDGLLAQQLAPVSRTVTAIDRSGVAVAQASKRLSMVANADAAVSEFSSEWGLTPESYDVVTMVSVLHELPLVPALERAASLLKPGGTLVVVGQAAPRGALDMLFALLAVPYAWALRLFYSWRGIYRPEYLSAAPVEPSCSLEDVVDAASLVVPGAEVHRGLLGRFRLRWSKPVEVAPITGEISYIAGGPLGSETHDHDGPGATDDADTLVGWTSAAN